MNDEIREQLIHLLAGVLGWALARLLAEKYLKEEKRRGLEGDAKEALLKAGATGTATLVSSAPVRRLS